MDGLQVRGTVQSTEVSDFKPGAPNQDFGRIVIEARKFDGEPYWLRIGFTQYRQDGTPTMMRDKVAGLTVGQAVAVAVEVLMTKAASGTWTKGVDVEVLGAAPVAPQNGKVPASAKA
jgi:hypothetical protein